MVMTQVPKFNVSTAFLIPPCNNLNGTCFCMDDKDNKSTDLLIPTIDSVKVPPQMFFLQFVFSRVAYRSKLQFCLGNARAECGSLS
jgi:hypothetical protein